MKTKYALVLSGGGLMCSYQVGALNYIEQNWRIITGQQKPMKFDIVSGISGGCLNGALVAMDKLSLLRDIWINQIGRKGASEIYKSDFIDTRSKGEKLKIHIDLKSLAQKYFSKIKIELGMLDKLRLIFSQQARKEIINRYLALFQETVKEQLAGFRAIADNSPLRDKLHKYLDRSQIKNTVFSGGFVSLNSGEYHSVKHSDYLSDEDFINGVLASASIPFVWNPVDKVSFNRGSEIIHSFNNIDGGVMNVSPLGDAIKLMHEDPEDCEWKIFVINCNSGKHKYEDFSNRSIGGIIARAFYQLTLTEVYNNDIEHFMRINDFIRQGEKKGIDLHLKTFSERKMKSFDATIICPENPETLGSPLVANEKLTEQRMAQGYETARKSIIF